MASEQKAASHFSRVKETAETKGTEMDSKRTEKSVNARSTMDPSLKAFQASERWMRKKEKKHSVYNYYSIKFHRLIYGSPEFKAVSPSSKTVYLMLASYGCVDGLAHPSNKTLAKKLGMTRRLVQRSIEPLIEAGLIFFVGRHYADPNNIKEYTNQYQILAPPSVSVGRVFEFVTDKQIKKDTKSGKGTTYTQTSDRKVVQIGGAR